MAQQKERAKTAMKRHFSSVSLPTPLVEKIEEVIVDLGYWPTRTAFIREATLEKLDKHKKKNDLREASK